MRDRVAGNRTRSRRTPLERTGVEVPRPHHRARTTRTARFPFTGGVVWVMLTRWRMIDTAGPVGAEGEAAVVRVELLGPVHVYGDDGARVEVGGVRLRMLLARLALEEGRTVRTDSL